ncbi:hypothetical protein M942_13255 [Enterobacter ludwigii]|nr:hypothetical protein M942_13255 [Enterobacter ludwigii]
MGRLLARIYPVMGLYLIQMILSLPRRMAYGKGEVPLWRKRVKNRRLQIRMV